MPLILLANFLLGLLSNQTDAEEPK